jgi:glycosyltransferase involved in cell wall biosynthesis
MVDRQTFGTLMSHVPQFTLITSTLNSSATLERCLDSVAAQTHPSFEHVIADGASSDDTLAIVERYQERYTLRLACSQPDTGLYQAWNRGVEKARGDWILFLGSDDFLLSPEALSRISTAILNNPAIQNHIFLFADTEAPHPQPDWATYCDNRWDHWLRGVTNYPTSVFIASQLFRQGHRFDESYRICADHKFFAEHDFFRNAAYIPVPLISFQKGGISSDTSLLRFHYRERRRMLHELGRPRPFFTEWYYWIRSRF